MTPHLAIWCTGCDLVVRDTGLAIAQQIIATHRCDGLFHWQWEHRYADMLAAVLDEAAQMLDAAG